MGRLTSRSLAFKMPHANVLQPRGCAFLNALEAKVGVLVMAEYKVLGESRRVVRTMIAFYGDKCTRDCGNRARSSVNCDGVRSELPCRNAPFDISASERGVPSPLQDNPTSTSKYIPPCISEPSS
jgi:hypothetical protein